LRSVIVGKTIVNIYRNIVVGLGILFLISGCIGRGDSNAENRAVIRVDDRMLTLAQFNEYFGPISTSWSVHNAKDHETIADARNRLLLQLVEEMIILRRADELDLDISARELDCAVADLQKDYSKEDFENMLLKQAISLDVWKESLGRRLLVQKVIQEDLSRKVSVSPEEIEAYYDQHGQDWTDGGVIRVRHILLRDETEAKSARKRLQRGDDFVALARLRSEAPEAERGGDMGWVARGQLPECLEGPLFKLKPGNLSPVIKTPFGFHIFQVIDRRESGKLKIEDCAGEIKDRIKKEKVDAAYGPWLANFRDRYDIEINEGMI
jgi:parvulin-like peptidyl-prolyl isomerase